MAKKKITLEDLAGMIAKGFNENTEQHRQILGILDKHAVMLVDHSERLKRIEKKLEGIVYRNEFEELKARVEEIEKILAMKKK
ncbi:MAG: hypothetical protein QME61_00110 [Patescibacteria group bacterium]|nr:hypothetical protein [Patescibacteria group bacterium]